MVKARTTFIKLSIIIVVGLLGCASRPKTFIRTMESTWATIELSDGLPYDKAWNSVVDLLVKKFDLEKLEREEGYIRTGWLYTWTGRMTYNYRVRVIVKFHHSKKKLELKSEAQYGGTGRWVIGTDTGLLATLT